MNPYQAPKLKPGTHAVLRWVVYCLAAALLSCYAAQLLPVVWQRVAPNDLRILKHVETTLRVVPPNTIH